MRFFPAGRLEKQWPIFAKHSPNADKQTFSLRAYSCSMTRMHTDSDPIEQKHCQGSKEAPKAGVAPASLREFLNQQFVYCVISQRAQGLVVGINMNPDQRCNFDCVYCEIDRSEHRKPSRVKVDVMIDELQRTLKIAHPGALRGLGYQRVPEELLELKAVALSGDGEPTQCPNFSEIVEAIVNLRTLEIFIPFKIVLITNATGLHLPDVQAGLALLEPSDEIWAKLDAGTQSYMNAINRPEVSLKVVLKNILELGRKRPVVIQSLFALINGEEPPKEEIEEYALRLRELKEAGAQIAMVQIYSAHRPAINTHCEHLPLRALSHIAKRVREVSGLPTEVF